ncbi:hypothetical protein CCUN_1667 [Campylobacter cuniculorum DSM 23162 = LMG 24588]|uniref:Uncharacterized protein n=1 Tax=Campylobacter cuniculorum DSM 23162 = LMG 24588 TaxID=1121267 RepID=A0A1W6BYS4_9BACT|nr:hypothetical protein CCUN_1667 [Campylobacter cuniculorum DSM 23162 = LMG 24588]
MNFKSLFGLILVAKSRLILNDFCVIVCVKIKFFNEKIYKCFKNEAKFITNFCI